MTDALLYMTDALLYMTDALLYMTDALLYMTDALLYMTDALLYQMLFVGGPDRLPAEHWGHCPNVLQHRAFTCRPGD
ncbi:hypothetical protein ACOMHN_008965 [Nucella lapillus]